MSTDLSKSPDLAARPRGGGARELFGAIVGPLQAFLRTESAGGVVLLACAVLALLWANAAPSSYARAFGAPLRIELASAVVSFTPRQLVDDGLMTLFFFVVGMEIKRELAVGELDTVGKATLPAIAAAGGMVVPAAIYLAANRGGSTAGWGVPIATDIAFSVGVLSLLRRRVPNALVVFLTALAIFDDVGGIVVIALFYGHGIASSWLLVAAALAVVLFALNRAYVTRSLTYVVLGAAIWYALHRGGVHATIAGVVVGLFMPAKAPPEGRRASKELALDRTSPLDAMVRRLHPLVAFGVMPLFALANAGVALDRGGLARTSAPVALGVAAGLFFGKPIGIFGFTLLAVKLRVAPLPGGSSRTKLLGVSVLAGIGFTVALFIAGLAFGDDQTHLTEAKMGILLGSLVSGVAAYVILRATPVCAVDE